ncbi:hypothetical protein G5B35_04840 [Parapusillimonas sp. SGNA-6]|nr:hypothetical protein [Parapusillimonas sp. SGNA-6]
MTGLPTAHSDHADGMRGRDDDAPTPRYAVLADDLTGAADAAVALAGPTCEAEILLEPMPHADIDAAVMAIDLDTRRMPVDAARDVTARSASALTAGYRHLFKKIDSTLRGHIGEELAALYRCAASRDSLGSSGLADLCIVAPAHPVMGRLIRDGRLDIRNAATRHPASGTAILPSDSGAVARTRQDDTTRGRATLFDQLAASGFTCTSLSIDEIRSRSQAQLTRLIEDSARQDMPALVCDGETMEDLHRIVRAALASDVRCIWVGSGGLAQALSACHAPSHANPGASPACFVKAKAGSRLFVVGSYSAVARQQIDALQAAEDVGVLALASEELLGHDHAEQRQILDTWLAQGQDVVVTVRPDGPIRPDQSLRLAAGLARLVAPTVGRLGALVCCGGDTSRALFDALGLVRIRARQSHETGITHIHADAWPALPIVLKAGAFGDPQTLARLRHRLAAPIIDTTTL